MRQALNKRELKYREEKMTQVAHATLNPDGRGFVRIHLIPPMMGVKQSDVSENIDINKYPAMVILNGEYYVPVNRSYSVLLNEFLKRLDNYAGDTVRDVDIERIADETVKSVHQIYRLTTKKRLKMDLKEMINVFIDIAYGKKPESDGVTILSVGDYAPFMRAPHRMDLMISSLSSNGKWNCNQHCMYCYGANQRLANVNELSTDKWKEIIDRCYKAGIAQVTFTGGEPTMRDDLPQLVGYAKKLVTRLDTNGVRMTKELCKKLFDASLDSVQVTLYSSNPDVHNLLVGANTFNDTVQGIKNIIDAGLNICVSTPLCSANCDYIETLKFLHELGVKYVTCSGLITTGNSYVENSSVKQLSSEYLVKILSDACQYCAGNGLEIAFTSPGMIDDAKLVNLNLPIPTCGACLSHMAITPDGNVVPCQSWLTSDPLGNILFNKWSASWSPENNYKMEFKQQAAWDSIWNSERCKSIRENSAKMNNDCPLNRNCLG